MTAICSDAAGDLKPRAGGSSTCKQGRDNSMQAESSQEALRVSLQRSQRQRLPGQHARAADVFCVAVTVHLADTWHGDG